MLMNLVLAVDLNATFQRSELLLNTTTRRTSWLAEDELSAERPGLGNVPLLSNVLADGGVEVLEVAAETLSSQGGPGDELVHAVGMFVPYSYKSAILKTKMKGRKLTVRVLAHQALKWRRQLLNGRRILEEQNSSIRRLETLDLVLVVGEDCRGQGLLGALHADVPKLVVLVAEKDDGAAGLDVEG